MAETFDIEKIKREIMLTTTQFILSKLGKENIANTENIEQEIEDFLNGPKESDKANPIGTETQATLQSVTNEKRIRNKKYPKQTLKTQQSLISLLKTHKKRSILTHRKA